MLLSEMQKMLEDILQCSMEMKEDKEYYDSLPIERKIRLDKSLVQIELTIKQIKDALAFELG